MHNFKKIKSEFLLSVSAPLLRGWTKTRAIVLIVKQMFSQLQILHSQILN